MTDMIIIHRAFENILPYPVVYPVKCKQCETLFDKTYAGNSNPFPGAYTVHLWNVGQKLINDGASLPPDPDSFVGQVLRRYM